MTLLQIANQVAARANLTSTTALARIKDGVRERYQWVLGDLGLKPSTRGIATSDTVVAYPYLTFYGVEKVFTVFDPSGDRLEEREFDQLRNTAAKAWPPDQYAISTAADNSVTIYINAVPVGAPVTFTADVLIDVDPQALTDGETPAFPSLFHDALVHGALAIELRKMEKLDLAGAQEALFDKRVAALRTFIAQATA